MLSATDQNNLINSDQNNLINSATYSRHSPVPCAAAVEAVAAAVRAAACLTDSAARAYYCVQELCSCCHLRGNQLQLNTA